MTPEILAMLGGGVTGFVMRLIAAQAENQARSINALERRQNLVDDSADRAAARVGGTWIRRFIVVCTMFAVIAAPFIVAFTSVDISVQQETSKFFGLFKGVRWEQVSGYVILPEVRQTALAIVGFYFGSSQVK